MRPPMMRPLAAQTRVDFPRVHRHWPVLGTFLFINLVVLLIGTAVSPGFSVAAAAWYDGLQKPAWAPTPQTFAATWTVLYVLMAIAAWWVARARPVSANKTALNLYGVQLLLNALWMPAFFGLHNPVLAFLDALALLLVLVITMHAFSRRQATAALLLVPYALWIAFTAMLTYEIWRLNV